MSLLKKAFAQADAKHSRRILLHIPETDTDLLCRTVTGEDMAAAQKGGQRLFPKDEGLAGLQALRALLATTCLEIWEDGKTVLDDNGDPVTFRDPALLAEAGVATASEAVAKLIGIDGDVMALGNYLLKESGFDATGARVVEGEGPDPTS